MKQSNHEKYLIVIGGPTASGKTAFAIRLARHFGAAILSADSRQFYLEMNIGTAKPTETELAQAPHYLINSLSIEQEYSVGDFEREGMQLLNTLFQKNDIVILAGGAGLYIKALCEGLDAFPEVPPEVRAQVEEAYREKGLSYLQEELARADPDYYAEVDRQNPHRLIRAIAVFRASGRPFSSSRSRIESKRDPEGSRPTRVHICSPILPRTQASEKTLETDWIEKRFRASPALIMVPSASATAMPNCAGSTRASSGM